ncbi:hypothetical protein AB0K48_56545, partial [Nonomuraea sp. NPDC055795]
MTVVTVPAFIRGQTYADRLLTYGSLRAPDPMTLVDLLPLGDPSRLADLQALRTAEIVDLLAELGSRLRLPGNPLLQEALDLSAAWSDMTPPLLAAVVDLCYVVDVLRHVISSGGRLGRGSASD